MRLPVPLLRRYPALRCDVTRGWLSTGGITVGRTGRMSVLMSRYFHDGLSELHAGLLQVLLLN